MGTKPALSFCSATSGLQYQRARPRPRIGSALKTQSLFHCDGDMNAWVWRLTPKRSAPAATKTGSTARPASAGCPTWCSPKPSATRTKIPMTTTACPGSARNCARLATGSATSVVAHPMRKAGAKVHPALLRAFDQIGSSLEALEAINAHQTLTISFENHLNRALHRRTEASRSGPAPRWIPDRVRDDNTGGPGWQIRGSDFTEPY